MPESTAATPSAIAVCASWPHACILPGTRDANGRAFFSSIGSASMSARIPIVGPVARLREAQRSRSSRCRSAGDPEPVQERLDALRGLVLVERELGMLVDPPPDVDHVVDPAVGGRLHAFDQGHPRFLFPFVARQSSERTGRGQGGIAPARRLPRARACGDDVRTIELSRGDPCTGPTALSSDCATARTCWASGRCSAIRRSSRS